MLVSKSEIALERTRLDFGDGDVEIRHDRLALPGYLDLMERWRT